MEQFDLPALYTKAKEVCAALLKADVAKCRTEKVALATTLQDDLMYFGILLAVADGGIDDDEAALIAKNLGLEGDDKFLARVKMYKNAPAGFADKIPSVLKYSVVSDAHSQLDPDPSRGQASMIFYDTFKLFGLSMLANRQRDVSDEATARFTDYLAKIEAHVKEYAAWRGVTQKFYTALEPEIGDGMTEEERQEKLQEQLDKLDALVGLTDVKNQVHNLVNLIKVSKMRETLGMKTADVSKHMVFSGNPGTGKTTVARMLAEIYHLMGVLRKGQLIEVDRSGLVRGYVGQTATQTQEVIESALGGVLFIDEAYSLTVKKGDNDFGQEAVDTLLKAMEDKRDDLVVIVAGYTNLMEEFLSSNPGLRSRFSNFIFFPDYTAEELMKILQQNLDQREYKMSDEARKRVQKLIEERVANKPENFANARDVRNMMEHAITNHATRVVDIEEAAENRELLSTLQPEDFPDWS